MLEGPFILLKMVFTLNFCHIKHSDKINMAC